MFGIVRRERVESDDAPVQPHLVFNWTSLVGGLVTACGLTGMAFFLVADLKRRAHTGYAGVTFVPPALVALAGLGLVVAGALAERRRRRRGQAPSIDPRERIVVQLVRMAQPRAIVGIMGLAVALSLLVLLVGAGSARLVEYTESNRFCTTTCHEVMGPEAAAYDRSPHARVPCVKCHVGDGADGYIRAKLNGLRQLYAVATGDFHRPIPTPIVNRRPTREMCEQCHWKERFIDYKILSRHYFLADDDNTPVEVKLMVKVGGGHVNGLMSGEGIHYHMLTEHRVEYVARDAARQEIVWVRVTNPDGSTHEYELESDPLTPEERASLPVHEMTCIDCHSRPAHQFRKPVDAVNAALATGRLPRELPMIKREAVRLLSADYATTAGALDTIATRLDAFYREQWPDRYAALRPAVERAVETIQDIFRHSVFPEMRASWRVHPDNIGHRDFPGCFRCHNDEMVDADGQAVFTDCTRCHLVLAESRGGVSAAAAVDFRTGNAFVHPDDEESVEEYTSCTDCHDGGAGVYE